MATCPICGRWNNTDDNRLTNAASMFDKKDYCFSHGIECRKSGKHDEIPDEILKYHGLARPNRNVE